MSCTDRPETIWAVAKGLAVRPGGEDGGAAGWGGGALFTFALSKVQFVTIYINCCIKKFYSEEKNNSSLLFILLCTLADPSKLVHPTTTPNRDKNN